MADPAANKESRPSKRTPQGWANFFNKELQASQRNLRKWHKTGMKTVKRYVDERGEGEDTWFRLNLFHANTHTLMSMLYGQLPKVEVARRYNDPDDDAARVASVLLERLLNNDIQENGEEYENVLRSCLEDRLVPGLGCATVRYEVETEQIEVTVIGEDGEEATASEERLLYEDAVVEYTYWGDVLWSWARNWSELRWVAFQHHMTKEEATARFGEKAKALEYQPQAPVQDKNVDPYDRDTQDSVDRAKIWEIWDRESNSVFWHQLDQELILDHQEDFLELENFFPAPPFLMANPTTTFYRPTPDFFLAQDLYNEVDRLETRISLITEAVKVVGVYDKTQEGVQRMLKEGIENDLVPVDNWAMMAEKGGLQGVIDWFPVEEIAQTLQHLIAQRNDTINMLYQVTGMSDILRGASSQSRVSATEQELKAKFASVRVQALQDKFAGFASDLLQIKAEIICKHFSPETIVQRANVQGMNQHDQQLVPQALQLIKDPANMFFRITIRPETVAMVDYAQKQQERSEYIQTLGFFLQSAQPIAEAVPGSMPMLLELLKWGLAGFKGSDEIEGVVDAAIEGAKDAPPKEDPQAAAEQAKMQVEQMKQQAKMQELQMKVQHDREKHQFEMRELQTKHQTEMQKLMADFQAKMQIIEAQLMAKTGEQLAQTEGKLIETGAQHGAKMEEIEANARAARNSEQSSDGSQ